MFDVKAKDAKIQITSLKMYIYSAGTKAEVWTRAGTHVGFEYSSSGWTKVAGKPCSTITWKMKLFCSNAFFLVAYSASL
jgi:hypothetical protein